MQSATYVGKSKLHGRGLFINHSIVKGTVVAIATVLPIDKKDNDAIEKTALGEYLFWWNDEQTAVVFGDLSFANHSDSPNCSIRRTPSAKRIALIALRSIKADEELTYDYGTVWFDAKP